MPRTNPIKRIFALYTSDLSYKEIERLIKKEANEVYEFFATDIPKPDRARSKFSRSLIFARSLFNAFLLKLTPARRIFYLAALLFFVFGLFQNLDGYLIIGFIILNFLLAFELADKLTAKDELDVARKIQFELIPQDHPEISKYEVTTYYQPAREVGGDYFDIIKSNDGKDNTYLIIGDISGKGMAAALYMVRVQAIIHLLIGKFSKIKEIIINLKNYFSKNLRKEFFLTIVGAKIDSKGTINLCRAGHNPVLHFKKSSKSFDELNPNGIGIGFNDRGTFEKTIEEIKIKPEEGDILCFFTDGLTETMNMRKIQFGQDRLKRIIYDNADKNVGDIKSQILREIEFFRGNAPQHDDLTMILLKAK